MATSTRHGGNASTSNNNASLTGTLSTPTLRTELVAIIALTTDSMRRDLLAVFEPTNTHNSTSKSETNEPDATGGSLIDAGVQRESRRTLQREHSDLSSPQTQGLRRAAVTWFDKWQIDVLRRVGEVLNVRPDAIRKARADAKAKAESVRRERERGAFVAWANGEDGITQGEDEERASGLPEGFESKISGMERERRVLVLDSVLLLLLSLERYSAHSRVLMLKLTRIFRLPESTLVKSESKVAESLLASAAAKMSAEESTQRQASEGAAARRWKIGAATVAGAALIGITGGLAAPILAAGVGGIMGGLGLGAVASLLGPLATNMVLVGGLFGAYGGRMTGRIMEKYAQEIRDFKFLPVAAGQRALGEDDDDGMIQLKDEETRQSHKLRVAVGISGSVTDANGFTSPWRAFSAQRIEPFALRWEMDALLQLGRKISEVLRGYAWDFAKFQLLSMVLAGLWPFGLLRAAGSLDSPFAIAKTRSDKAGKVLADALVNRVQGDRPVTLVGFGLGARVVYSCLLQLAELNAFGLVESVVVMGAPTPSDVEHWRRIRAIVSGRVVNCFSGDDFMLGFLYRASSAQMGIAGVQEIEGVSGVENFDFTALVKSHDRYPDMVGTILQRVGFGDLDGEVVRQQQESLNHAGSQTADEDLIGGLAGLDMQDNTLAKEDELGNIVKVENEKAAMMARSAQSRRDQPPAYDSSGSITSSAKGPDRSVRGLATTQMVQPNRDHAATKAQSSQGGKIDLVAYQAAEPSTFAPKHEGESDEEEEERHTIRMENHDDPLVTMAPEPEPDYGPDRETVHFGSDGRGFDVRWDYRG